MNTERKKFWAECLGYKWQEGLVCNGLHEFKGVKSVGPLFTPTDSPYYWQILEGLDSAMRILVEKELLAPIIGIDGALWYNENRELVLEAIYTVIGEG